MITVMIAILEMITIIITILMDIQKFFAQLLQVSTLGGVDLKLSQFRFIFPAKIKHCSDK